MKNNQIIAVLILAALFITFITACSPNEITANGTNPSNAEPTPGQQVV